MNNCIFKPCLRCVPACLPIDTPASHAEHARIVEEFQASEAAPYYRENEENSR
jgi:hypothetical protein